MPTPWDFPRTPRALHDWIAAILKLRICRNPVLSGHNAPFDYLLHTHFEGARIDADPNIAPVMPGPNFVSLSSDIEPLGIPGAPPPLRASHPPDNGTLASAVSAPPNPTSSLSHCVTPSLPPREDTQTSCSQLPSVPPSLRLSVSSPFPPDLVLWANRGGGKTFLGALATTLDLVFKPGIEVRILAGSLEQAARMFAHLRRFFETPALTALIAGRATQRRLTLTNQSTVEILAASQASVRGTRVQKLRCDEVDLFDFQLWEAAQLTTRSTTCERVHVRGAVECLSTMHRPHGLMFNLVKDTTTGARRLLKWGVLDTLELCPPDRPCEPCPLFKECRGLAKRTSNPDRPPRPVAAPGDGERQGEGSNATTADNDKTQPVRDASDQADPSSLPALAPLPIPLPVVQSHDGARGPEDPPDPGHIPIDDAITLKSRVSQSAWESEMLCLRPSRTHAVFPEFDPKLHVVDDIPREGITWIAGMDFGFRALTVILWGVIDEADTLWIAHEHAHAEMLLAEHVAAITRAPAERGIPLPSWVAIDPAGRQRNDQTGVSNADVLSKAGLVVRYKTVGLGESLALVRTRLKPALGPPRLRIHRRCAQLIEALERYHYPDDDPESMLPVKDGPDHAADALRYLILNLDKKTKVESSNYTEQR